MIEVKLSFATTEEMVAFFTRGQVEMRQAPATSAIPAAAAPEAEAPAKGKPGRKPKNTSASGATQAESGANILGNVEAEAPSVISFATADPVVSEPESKAVEAEAPVASIKQYTIEDAREALKRLNEEGGLDAVRDLLARYRVSRISELAVEQYGALIADCPV